MELSTDDFFVGDERSEGVDGCPGTISNRENLLRHNGTSLFSIKDIERGCFDIHEVSGNSVGTFCHGVHLSNLIALFWSKRGGFMRDVNWGARGSLDELMAFTIV